MLRWLLLFVMLCLIDFGFFGSLSIVMSLLAFCAGLLATLALSGRASLERLQRSIRQRPRVNNPLYEKPRQFSFGRPSVVNRTPKLDRRLTGSSVIDSELNDLLDLAFRDFVHSWHRPLFGELSSSRGDDEFVCLLRRSFGRLISSLADCCKEADFVSYLTTRLVNDFATHVRLFKQAERSASSSEEVVDAFFRYE